MRTILYGSYNDYRIRDNPALSTAAQQGDAVIPVFVDAAEEGDRRSGAAGRWWQHRALKAFRSDLQGIGSKLIIRSGASSTEMLSNLVEEAGADAVFWNRRYEPGLAARDRRVEEALQEQGVETKSFRSYLLHEPCREIRTQAGSSYQVFTYFWKTFRRTIDVGKPIEAPESLPAPDKWPSSESLSDIAPEAEGISTGDPGSYWDPSESGARNRLDRFLSRRLAAYPQARDRPDIAGTSALSPHLHSGTISPRQVWHAVKWERERPEGTSEQADAFLRQLGWREFSYHVLLHNPHTTQAPLREKFEAFDWRGDEEALEVWKNGQTGYPIVDAGMRQLLETGWMHNRVRMIVASFLTKDLLIPWQEGEAWFWERLVDADLANNVMGWQWSAGCGADAQPFFRIFNPVRQGREHDPEGRYVRRHVPELKDLSNDYVHAPWEAPEEVLEQAGVELGATYPRPIVDHSKAREAALEAYEQVK